MTAAPVAPAAVDVTAPDRAVPFARCDITAEARAGAMEVMASGWMTAGTRTVDFEHRFAAWVGAPDAVAVSSCTAALELCLRAMDLPPGAPVLTPTLTFCGAVEAIVHAGLRPVLLDADDATLTVSPEAVERATRSGRPAAMVVQHMAGHPAPVRELAGAARLPLARVVEDAAHGLGGAVDDDPVGTVSGATCFSFYATKNLPIGEGGAITTADPDLAVRLREARQHGMSHDAWTRYLPGGRRGYDVRRDGLKANFTDLQAAIGLGQLTHLTAWQRRRAALAARYDAALADLAATGALRLPPRPHTGRHAWHLYVVRVEPAFGRSRDDVADALAARGIGTSVHFVPVHRFTWFRSLLGDLAPQLPVAEALAPTLLSLPFHPGLSTDDVDHVGGQLARLHRARRKAAACDPRSAASAPATTPSTTPPATPSAGPAPSSSGPATPGAPSPVTSSPAPSTA